VKLSTVTGTAFWACTPVEIAIVNATAAIIFIGITCMKPSMRNLRQQREPVNVR
jgi:hypothetical protein